MSGACITKDIDLEKIAQLPQYFDDSYFFQFPLLCGLLSKVHKVTPEPNISLSYNKDRQYCFYSAISNS